MKKSVIILGKGALAIRIANWFLASSKYKLSMVVPVVPEPTWTDSFLQWAKKNSIPHIESGHYEDIDRVRKKDFTINLAFSVFYDKIIHQWFIKKCRKILNLHNSPLPKYRGVSPINWALKNKETKHGITLHELTREVDQGPIIAQLTYTIYPDFDEVKDVYKRSLAYGWTLFEQTMPILDKIKPYAQVKGDATYYSRKQNHLLGDRKGFVRSLLKKSKI